MTNEILSKFQTSANGLCEKEVIERQKKYGLNEIVEKKAKNPLFLFLEQFIDVLIGLLFVAALAAYAVGDVIDVRIGVYHRMDEHAVPAVHFRAA